MPEADFVPFFSNPSDRYPDSTLGAKSGPKFLGRVHESLRSRHFSPMNMLEDGYNSLSSAIFLCWKTAKRRIARSVSRNRISRSSRSSLAPHT